MTDENTSGGNPPSQAAASSEPTIPKQRFDELVAERNELRQQTNMMNQTLNQLLEQQRTANRPQPVESQDMKDLREQNPALYKRLVSQERRLQQLTAASAAQVDFADRSAFVIEFGDEGKKRLTEVEKYLGQERAQGNYRVSRAGVYQWLLGQERLRQESVPPNPAKVAASQAPAVVPPKEEIPSTTPSSARFLNGAQAPSGFTEQTISSREEQVKQMRERLKNTTF